LLQEDNSSSSSGDDKANDNDDDINTNADSTTTKASVRASARSLPKDVTEIPTSTPELSVAGSAAPPLSAMFRVVLPLMPKHPPATAVDVGGEQHAVISLDEQSDFAPLKQPSQTGSGDSDQLLKRVRFSTDTRMDERAPKPKWQRVAAVQANNRVEAGRVTATATDDASSEDEDAASDTCEEDSESDDDSTANYEPEDSEAA
jgi:hypothetical protein